MEDPDLDIRYDLPDFLASRIPGLVNDGYDYGTEATILELYMTSKEPVDLERIVEVAKTHERWGKDVGDAIRILTNSGT